MIGILGLAGLAPLLDAEDPWITLDEYQERLETFYNETDTRPDFVWYNREDVMYHDHSYPPALAAAPEYCAFIKKTWVFNRSMQWIRKEGVVLCYEDAGFLDLTGEKQVSAWYTGPDNALKNEGDFSIWASVPSDAETALFCRHSSSMWGNIPSLRWKRTGETAIGSSVSL